ncbi:MAG: 50S ribosome-binding GTPase, partial [Acinetobacter baumannii]|nr:50S ribosome-binding GTPase [Acinetobacter baumannii]
MTRTKRQLAASLKLVDCVAEIIDARVPFSSRNPDLRKLINNKPRIVLMNKCDIADKTQNQKWIAVYKNAGITALPVDCKTGKGLNAFMPAVRTVLADKIKAWEAKGMKGKTIKVMVVGIPNVGKSSFINKMVKQSKAKVEDRPGVTRGNQWFTIGKGFELLDKVDPNKKVNFTEEQLSRLSELLEIKLQEFNVKAQVVEAQPGPVVTRFELDLAPGVKASKVTNISRDLARSMSMASVRVVEVIPGKPYIGIEVPNSAREMVRLIELLETPAYRDPSALISMAMGKDISGNPVLTDLAKAPHMLVAGTTGSGKSVAVNSMILSMLLKYTPDQLRLILIDPKQLELANYNDIPHLLTPVVTDMKDAVSALNWCVNEMERRYKLMSFLKIRKLSDYNRKVEEAIANGEDLIDPTWKPSDSATQERAPRLTPLPSIVIVADEFADMIMQVGKKAEEMITRLAQKSRAAGIHLLLATQRPSVDVITGLIKANIPTRVALRVNSKIDSRTILDAGGAEDLLGHGDML